MKQIHNKTLEPKSLLNNLKCMNKTLQILKKEFLEMLPPTIFFFVIFHILFFVRSLFANKYSISVESSIVATIGALIVGKAVLIADKLKLLK